MLSFEQIIGKDVDISNTFEGHTCDKFNLMMTNDFRSELEKDAEREGVILVHDKLSQEEEARLLAKFKGANVRLVGALWFYLSVYFNFELPMDCFTPAV